MKNPDSYTTTRAAAQRAANFDGMDRGLEWCSLSNAYRSFVLPQRQNRFGFELRCEVVSCENLERCAKGHGPK